MEHAMNDKKTYVETFDHGPRGWIGWGTQGGFGVEVKEGAAISRGPWWIDCNHCNPGAGYLHLLFAFHTRHLGNTKAQLEGIAGRNPFVEGGYPTDFRNARITVRVKGEVDLKGSRMVLLAQGSLGKIWVNQVLAGQPIPITPEWSEQTIQLVPDQAQWINMGSRFDRVDRYGKGPIADLLADLNGDIIFVLFPLDVVPLEPGVDPHRGWADRDYTADRSRLPSGHVMLDEVRIEFPC
jgi:hypothetical protein